MKKLYSRPTTDRSRAISAPEYVWDDGGNTENHDLVLDPILQRLAAHGARTVLDLGCGNGALSARIARHGYRVVGCDSSRSGIDIASRSFPDVRFFLHDLGHPLPEEYFRAFDAVISIEVIEHLLLPRLLLRSAKQALAPGGLLVTSTPYHGYVKNLALALVNGFDAHWHPERDYGHVKFFSRKTLTSLLGSEGFSHIQFSTVGRVSLLAKSMLISGVAPA